jgi:chromosome segregation protein
MVFISRLRLRNFKSFKAADIVLPKTYICFAGPNGSGKSNLCDAIRFVSGETSLRSLRAKKVKELIHADSRSAEVTLNIDDGEKTIYEIKRAIREDGKILYRLNGEKTTRTAVVEALKKYNLDQSGRNTVAQGEVQRIINMNGKERRTIIDSVAGISDFEEKKKEAMSELATVDGRIKDANLVLGERRAFIEELGREKEIASKFIDSKKKLTDAKGTLIKHEIERLSGELERVMEQEEKLISKKSEHDANIAALEKDVSEVETNRAKTSNELKSKQSTQELIRKIEELKASVSTRSQSIKDKSASVAQIEQESIAITSTIEEETKSIEGLKAELVKLEHDLTLAQKELASAGGIVEDSQVRSARLELEGAESELNSLKERLVSLTADQKSKEQLKEAKNAEISSISMSFSESDLSAEDDVSHLRKDSAKISAEIDSNFARTKEINAEIIKIDQKLLELKEKASIFKIRSSPALANPALSFVAELKKSGERGIFGTVADLITFDSKFSAAVESAGGSRLLYVVVDSVDTATSIIEKLKRAKAGRATFIPINSIRAPPKPKGTNISVLDVVNFDESARPAIEYVFAETLLVETVADAKRLGVGSARMVTLEGEIFERSGIISGGRTDSGILGSTQLRKIESELAETKSTKDSLIAELYSIREEESKLRSERSAIDLKIRTIEIQNQVASDQKKAKSQLVARKSSLESEIKSISEAILSNENELKLLNSQIASKSQQITFLKSALTTAEDQSKKKSEASGKKIAGLTANVSSIKATIDGKKNELALRSKELSQKQSRVLELDKTKSQDKKSILQNKKFLSQEEVELKGFEEQISSTSKEIEKLFEKLKEYESEFVVIGKKIGQLRVELEKINKELNQLEIKKATSGTHLEDLKSEFKNYSEFEVLDLSKDELSKIISEVERLIASLGNVNLASIDMYDKKKAEMDEIETRISTLNTEREAIMSMIAEIDDRKKEAFTQTYRVVSSNFSNMFKYVDVGEGHLYMDKPTTPFESGLFIKLRRNNKDYSLDALSGGEKTLVALMFIFALQLFKPAPFYILDEIDAALDKANSKRLSELISRMANDSQFIVVSHNDTVMSSSESVIGVSKTGGASRVVGVKLKQVASA